MGELAIQTGACCLYCPLNYLLHTLGLVAVHIMLLILAFSRSILTEQTTNPINIDRPLVEVELIVDHVDHSLLQSSPSTLILPTAVKHVSSHLLLED